MEFVNIYGQKYLYLEGKTTSVLTPVFTTACGEFVMYAFSKVFKEIQPAFNYKLCLCPGV